MAHYLIQIMDREVLFYFNGLMAHNEWFKILVYILARYLIIVFFVVGIYLWFRKSPRDHDGFMGLAHHENRQAVVFALLALGLGFVVDIIISQVLPRQRPFVSYPGLVKNLQLTVDLTSFPSRHAIAVFTLATSIWLTHLWHFRGWGIFLFICAILIAWARVAAGVHYPSDVIAGMIIGVISAWLIHENQDWIKWRLFRDFGNK